MDPDLVADAGVQHDDPGDSATSADGCCDGGSDDSWARVLLRRRWVLSRKVAIAVVAATAAPVVAPPLLVLSLAGVVLSLPFAAYLASLAATDRLMGALLPPPRTQPYHTCDVDDDEFLDAPEAPGGEAPVSDHWRDTEKDIFMEENESFVSLPMSWEPRFSEQPVPSSADVEDRMARGEIPSRELDHESLVLDNREHEEEGAAMEDSEYVTMEMEAPPRSFDVFGPTVPVKGDEDNIVQRMVDARFLAKEAVHELSVSDNEDRSEDGKGTGMEGMESCKETPSLGVDITESSDFLVPALGNEGVVVQRGNSEIFSVRKSGQDSHLPDIGDTAEDFRCKTKEEIPLQEVNVSESSVLDAIKLQRNIEGEVTVEVVVDKMAIDTNPITGEVAHEQVDSIATALPEGESLQTSNIVAQELQAMAEVAYVDDILDTTLTEDIVLHIGDTVTEGTEDQGEGGVSSVVPVVTADDVTELVSSRSPAISGISDDMTSVKSKPDVDCSSQTTGYTLRNKEFWKKECVKTEENKTMDKVPTRSMAPRNINVSKPSVSDDQSKLEDEVTVEMVLEDVTSDTGDLVVVGVQLNVIASESDSPSVSGHVVQESQAVSEGAFVDEIRGSIVLEDSIKDFSDRTTEGVEHHGDGGTSSFVSGVLEVTVDDGKDLVSCRSTPHASARDSASSVEGKLVSDNPHQTAGVPVKEGFERNVVAEDMDKYTEEQLREQLDTLRTITGYCPSPSLTLEAELVELYIFVGVEPPVSSRDASDLNDLNTKLRFLKSIIGVE